MPSQHNPLHDRVVRRMSATLVCVARAEASALCAQDLLARLSWYGSTEAVLTQWRGRTDLLVAQATDQAEGAAVQADEPPKLSYFPGVPR
jgi:hypothetical protein